MRYALERSSTILAALVAVVISFGIAARDLSAAEGDCDFCKKDHKKICADECGDQDKSEGCVKKCVQSKCKASCGDVKKEGKEGKEKKEKKDKEGKKDKKEGKEAKAPKEGKKNAGKKDKK